MNTQMHVISDFIATETDTTSAGGDNSLARAMIIYLCTHGREAFERGDMRNATKIIHGFAGVLNTRRANGGLALEAIQNLNAALRQLISLEKKS